MNEFKLIKEDTDISSLKMHKMDWDVEVGGVPYQVVDIEGYVHSIGGKFGVNTLWAYPRLSSPMYETLVEYNGNGGASWGIEMKYDTFISCKWDESELCTRRSVMITRNGKPFYLDHSINHALYLIDVINDHPLDLNMYKFDEKMIGRKVWWRSQPAIITKWIGNGQACVILEPDGIDKFETPVEFRDDDFMCDPDDEKFIKTSIFDEHIWWFREGQ